MSVLSVKNLQETFIGKNIARTANAQVTDATITSTYIADGEVLLLNSSGTAYASGDSYSSSPWVQLVGRNGDNLVFSSKIYGNKVTSYLGRDGALGAEQITTIGYNGTTGSLDITAGLDFQLTLIENQDDMMWSEQKKKNVTSVPNNLVTSQKDLASYIVKNVSKKYMIDGLSITAAMLNNGTGDAFTVASGTLTCALTHGSNVITFNLAVTNATMGAGALVRLGATGSGRGVTVPVYTIQGAHPTISNAYILDQPYMGPSNSALATANMGLVTTQGSSYGVRFTGKYLTSYRRDFFKFKRTAFTVQMSGFGSTLLSKTQNMSYGYGDGRLVLEEESFSKGFEGALNRMSVPLPIANETFTADGSSTTSINTTYADAFTIPNSLYDCITIEFFSSSSQTVVASPNMPQLIKIYMYNGANQGDRIN